MPGGRRADGHRLAEHARRRPHLRAAPPSARRGRRAARRPSRGARCRSRSVREALVTSVAWTAPPVSRHRSQESTVPKESSPRSARGPRVRARGRAASGSWSRRSRDRGRGRSARGTLGSSPSARSRSQSAAVRRPCQTIAFDGPAGPSRAPRATVGLALVGDPDRGHVGARSTPAVASARPSGLDRWSPDAPRGRARPSPAADSAAGARRSPRPRTAALGVHHERGRARSCPGRARGSSRE